MPPLFYGLDHGFGHAGCGTQPRQRQKALVLHDP